MKYIVAEAKTASALQQQVQPLLDKGWVPTGGVAVATYGVGSWWYYQALILPDSRPR